MTDRQAGWDQQEIARVSQEYFGDDRRRLADAIGASTTGRNWHLKISEHICRKFGSIDAFGRHYPPIITDGWSDEMSVLFTSFWGWSPETWGTIGWSGKRGLARRSNLLEQLSDPFIAVCYVTSNRTDIDPDLQGMIAGYYVVSHETGDRNDFTHPIHHGLEPKKWQHSLRALRAFSYLPEYRPKAMEVFPNLSRHARHVSSMAVVISDREIIRRLRSIPHEEVELYQTPEVLAAAHMEPLQGMVRAGPAASDGYEVTRGSQNLPRDIYILRLTGNAGAYLGRQTENRTIIKIGLSASPDLRRQALQKAMPRGLFRWKVLQTLRSSGLTLCANYSVAVRAEDAMKKYLAKNAEWLGGEFYLASEEQIETAWRKGCAEVNQGR